MSITQIVGPKIVPSWADPAEWVNTRTYEPLTYVSYQGDSYQSKQSVPLGIPITNSDYWVRVSGFNAQAEALQRSMKQTIDTAENNVNNALNKNNAKMDVLQNNVNTQVNALSATTAQVETNKNNVNTLFNYSANHMVIIGDSYSSASHLNGTLWCNIVAKHMNMQLHNFADPGAGYIHPGDINKQNFSGEIDRAAADTSFNNNQVGIVILIGGVNDFIFSKPNITNGNVYMKTYVLPTFDKLVTSFPNARIYVGVNSFANIESVNNQTFSTLMLERALLQAWNNFNSLSTFNPAIIPMSLIYLWWNNTILFENSVKNHPNQTSHNLLARLVLGYLSGRGWQNLRGTYYLPTQLIALKPNVKSNQTGLQLSNITEANNLVLWGFTENVLSTADNEQSFQYVNFNETYWSWYSQQTYSQSNSITSNFPMHLALPTGIACAGVKNPGGHIRRFHGEWAANLSTPNGWYYGFIKKFINNDSLDADNNYGNAIFGVQFALMKPAYTSATGFISTKLLLEA